MRKRNILVAALCGVLGTFVLTGTASAAVGNQTYTANVTPTKQDSKVRGGVTFSNQVTTTYTGTKVPPGGAGCAPPATVTVACQYFPPATKTVLTFDRDLAFYTKGLTQCPIASIAGKDTAGAVAACPKSVVSSTGFAKIHTLTEPGTPAGNPGTLNAVVTAINGAPSGGSPTIILHTDVIGSTTKPDLVGVLTGNVLTVNVPVTPGTVIEDFGVTVKKLVVSNTKNKKTGKRTKKFYVSAKCPDGTWTHSETTTFQDGSTKTGTSSQNCQKKPAPKK